MSGVSALVLVWRREVIGWGSQLRATSAFEGLPMEQPWHGWPPDGDGTVRPPCFEICQETTRVRLVRGTISACSLVDDRGMRAQARKYNQVFPGFLCNIALWGLSWYRSRVVKN